MTTIAPVDTSSFNPAQLNAYNAAAVLAPTPPPITPPKVTPPVTPSTPAVPPPSTGAQTAENDANKAKMLNAGKPGYDVFGNPTGTGGADIQQARVNGGTYTATDGKQYYNYDNTQVGAPSSQDTGTQNGTTNTDTNLPDQTDRAALAQAQADYQTTAKQVQDTILNIQNGVTPLTAGEQAQIAGLQQQFEQLIQQQTLQNTGATGLGNVRGYQTGAAEYDPTFQVKTIGSIVSAGAAKISDLQIKEASAIATLTQSFKDSDIKAVQDAWSIYQDASKARQDALQKTVDDTAKAIKDAQDAKIAADKVQYDTVTKPIQDIQQEVLKNTGDSKLAAQVGAAPDVNSAIALAGEALQTATGTLGDYLQYKRDSEAKGLTPMDYTAYQDAQNAKDLQNKISEAYATEAAKNQSDANFTASDKNQQKLEEQYRQVLTKEFSARTGSLGIENAKVNQANHLNSLFKQYYDPKTGNYNIPTAQYAELAIGLANMISPTGQSSDSDRAEIKSKTSVGDIKGAIQYITGVPQTGNSQAIIKNLIDSVDRQAETAVRNRQAALDDMKSLAPTDLDPSRVDALNKATNMVSYEGQDRVSKANVDAYVKANPSEAESVAKLYEVPGATDQDIEQYLIAQGKMEDPTGANQ